MRGAAPAPGFPPHDRGIRFLWAAADVLIVALAGFAAQVVRYDFAAVNLDQREVGTSVVVLTSVFVAGGLLIGPYTVRHVRGSFEEAYDLAVAVLAAVVVTTLLNEMTTLIQVPHGLPLLAGAFALLGMFAARFFVRSWRYTRRAAGAEEEKVIIYGAGEGGRQLIRALHRDQSPDHRLVPVAVIDDDSRKRRLRIEGVRVVGGRSALEKTVEKTGAETLVVAIPSASPEALLSFQEEARRLALKLLVLPGVKDLFGPAKGGDLRELNLEDLLGRQRVSLDMGAIADSLAAKCVLVTGAGGSIGSELCRQIARFGPGRLVLLDRDESALFYAQMSLTGRALLDDGNLLLCDIRDAQAVDDAFSRIRPDIVFHAAALKHLTLLEQYPVEAWKSNVLGTANVLAAARRSGVSTFVNISTDKAAYPTSVLGHSKRIAERLTAEAAAAEPGAYVSVRFGNVLGSRGSVVDAFTSQIEQGGPITVTHPDVERFFMLIPEACQLVLQASAIGTDGEVMVLDMGKPVRIVDVARSLIELSGRTDIEIEYTGLRVGEKMTEDLFAADENVRPTRHPLISRVAVPPLALEDIAVTGFPDDNSAVMHMSQFSLPSPLTVEHIR
jgi:FlaA1/EpsC-like NDP-sugar epimerase